MVAVSKAILEPESAKLIRGVCVSKEIPFLPPVATSHTRLFLPPTSVTTHPPHHYHTTPHLPFPFPQHTMSDTSSTPDVFSVSQDLVPDAVIKTAGASEIDFDGLLSPPLKLHEDLKNGCGGQLWPAGMVLSKYMLRKHREDLAGKEM
jgi:hypothetical protein